MSVLGAIFTGYNRRRMDIQDTMAEDEREKNARVHLASLNMGNWKQQSAEKEEVDIRKEDRLAVKKKTDTELSIAALTKQYINDGYTPEKAANMAKAALHSTTVSMALRKIYDDKLKLTDSMKQYNDFEKATELSDETKSVLKQHVMGGGTIADILKDFRLVNGKLVNISTKTGKSISLTADENKSINTAIAGSLGVMLINGNPVFNTMPLKGSMGQTIGSYLITDNPDAKHLLSQIQQKAIEITLKAKQDGRAIGASYAALLAEEDVTKNLAAITNNVGIFERNLNQIMGKDQDVKDETIKSLTLYARYSGYKTDLSKRIAKLLVTLKTRTQIKSQPLKPPTPPTPHFWSIRIKAEYICQHMIL